jgi:hypothetical protein
MSLLITKQHIYCVLSMNLDYIHEINNTLKLNQFSLKIVFIVFQTKHILSWKVWLSFNEEKEKNQNNISSHVNLFFEDYSL